MGLYKDAKAAKDWLNNQGIDDQNIIKLIDDIHLHKDRMDESYRDYVKNSYKKTPLLCLDLAILLKKDVVFKPWLEEIDLDALVFIIQEVDSDIRRGQEVDSECINTCLLYTSDAADE